VEEFFPKCDAFGGKRIVGRQIRLRKTCRSWKYIRMGADWNRRSPLSDRRLLKGERCCGHKGECPFDIGFKTRSQPIARCGMGGVGTVICTRRNSLEHLLQIESKVRLRIFRDGYLPFERDDHPVGIGGDMIGVASDLPISARISSL